MIEWHGWATIKATPENRDTEDSELDAVLTDVRRILADAAGRINEVIDLRPANYDWQLWFAGSHNHVADVVPLFRAVALVAPGSYGLLYLLDDELPSPANEKWQVWVMKRGEVLPAMDTFLSPFHPMVEDMFTGEA